MDYKLRECREKAGKSQLQAAIEIETSQQQISKWERGIQDIVLAKAIRLAKYYKVTLDELAGLGTTEQKK